jgi:hypothetical protein
MEACYRLPVIYCNRVFDCFRVVLSPQEYDLCDRLSFNRGSNSKKGAFGEGLENSPEDTRRVERRGLLGEYTVATLLGLHFDCEYKKHGDKYDHLLHGLSIDDKLLGRVDRDVMLVYYRHESGRVTLSIKDFYVICHLVNEDRGRRHAEVQLTAFVPGRVVLRSPECKGRLGKGHNNLEVSAESWLPIDYLFEAVLLHQKYGPDVMIQQLSAVFPDRDLSHCKSYDICSTQATAIAMEGNRWI